MEPLIDTHDELMSGVCLSEFYSYQTSDLEVKKWMNAMIVKTAKTLGYQGKGVALALDDPNTMLTTGLLATIGVTVTVPNDVISVNDAALISKHLGNCIIIPSMINDYLKFTSTRYNIVYLDYCGTLYTNQDDIDLVISKHLDTGDVNQGSVVAFTFSIYRNGSNSKEILDYISNVCDNNNKTFECFFNLEYGKTMYTLLGIIREKFM